MEVGIVSYGHTKYGILEEDTPDLIKKVIDECMDNVENGISPKDVDCIIVSCVDNAYSEQHQTGTLAWEYLGNPDAYGFKVESACVSGSLAAYQGRKMIEAGQAKNILVVGFEKMNKFSRDRITEILAHGSSPEERNGCQIWACQCFGEQRRDKHRQVGHGHNFGAIAKSHGYGFSA